MGIYCSRIVEYINTLGPNPKVIKCSICKKRKWRQKETIEYFNTNGCITCRLTKKYKNALNTISKKPSRRCSGRYNELINGMNFHVSLKSKPWYLSMP